ncbi:MAG: DNA repair protein RecO [Deltaproteobacteria bacterium]|nr:DNA repair protein RecO [Deltaproteobacteria bacterium]
MKRPPFKTEAFVLRFLNYGESDCIVTFFTREFGKLRGIAKGARRSKKRFSNAIEPFSYSTLLFSRRGDGGLAIIENCDVIEHYPGIRADLEKTMTASYMIDLVDQFTAESKKSAGIFQLLDDFMKLLETGNRLEETTRFFELRLLMLSGYAYGARCAAVVIRNAYRYPPGLSRHSSWENKRKQTGYTGWYYQKMPLRKAELSSDISYATSSEKNQNPCGFWMKSGK